MSTDRETTRLVRSWLEEGVTALPDRVLDAVLDQVPATPQRRPWWPTRRIAQMNRFLPATVAAAAVLVVALIVYNVLLRSNATTGGPPSPLAEGTFLSHGGRILLDATGGGASVTGTMSYIDTANSADRFVVSLECARTTAGGLVAIGGPVTESTIDSEPKGGRVAIVLQPGSPVRAVIHTEGPDPAKATCQAFLETIPDVGDAAFMSVMEPIDGVIDLAP
jgi:hypothetical protein